MPRVCTHTYALRCAQAHADCACCAMLRLWSRVYALYDVLCVGRTTRRLCRTTEPYYGAVPRSRTTDARKQLQNSVITSVFSVFKPIFDTKHVFCIINICATNVTLSYDCAQLPRVFGSNRCFRMDACGCYYAICRHQRIGGWMMKMLRRGGGLSSSQNAPPDVASVSMQRLRKGIIRRLRCARPAWVGDAAGTSDDLRNFI